MPRERRAARERLKDTLATTGRTLRTTSGGRFAADTMSALGAVIHGFRGENIGLRASALTYVTIFSLVPTLTVALVLLQSLHQVEFQHRLRDLVDEILAPGIREGTGQILDRFIDRASSVAAGWIGFGVLAFSSGLLLKNLDESLNEIWNVRGNRPIWARLLIYSVILLLGPLLVAASLAGSADLRAAVLETQLASARALVSLTPWLASVFSFTLLYKLAPAARVRLRSAFAGGLLAGVGWELAKRIYAAFGAQIVRFNPIYGSLGAAPLFLTWIYVSWLLVLFGARLAYAIEHAAYLQVYGRLGDTPRTREIIATQIAQQVTLSHYLGQPAPAVKELARRLDVPAERVGTLVDQLKAAGLLSEVERSGLIPGRPPDELSVAEISRAVSGTSQSVAPSLPPEKAFEFQKVGEVFARLDADATHSLERVRWTDLIADRIQLSSAPPAAVARRNP